MDDLPTSREAVTFLCDLRNKIGGIKSRIMKIPWGYSGITLSQKATSDHAKLLDGSIYHPMSGISRHHPPELTVDYIKGTSSRNQFFYSFYDEFG